MARVKAADLFVSLTAESARFRSEMNQAAQAVGSAQARTNRHLATMQRGFATAARQVTMFVASFIGIGGAIALVRGAATATMEAERAAARLNAVYRATGGAVGIARGELDAMADAMARTTLFDDEDIRSAMAALLVFRDVQGDTFREALGLAADLAEAFGGDVVSAASALGKALAEPGENLRALKEAGVTFTDVEIKMLQAMAETGRIAEAQRIILDRLIATIGGTAGEFGEFEGSVHAVAVQWEELLETLGSTDGVIGRNVMIGLNRLAGGLFMLQRGMAGLLNPEGLEGMALDLSRALEDIARLNEKLALERENLSGLVGGRDLLAVPHQKKAIADLEAKLRELETWAALLRGNIEMGLKNGSPFEMAGESGAPPPSGGPPPAGGAFKPPPGSGAPFGGDIRHAHERIAELGELAREARAAVDAMAAGIETDLLRAQGATDALLRNSAEATIAKLREMFDAGAMDARRFAELTYDVERTLLADLIRLDQERTAAAVHEADERARIAREEAQEIRQIFAGTEAEIRSQFMAGAFDLGDIAQALLSDLASRLFEFGADSIFDMLAGSLFGGGGGGIGVGGGSFAGGTPDFDFSGFEHGGSFTVGGVGGADSQMVGFAATPGERVTVATPGAGQGGGDVNIVQHFHVNQGADAAAVNALRATAAEIKRQTIAAVIEGQRRTAGAMLRG